MLAPAAVENVRTWQLEEHEPTTFEVTFRYIYIRASKCFDDGVETVVLRLPVEVEVSAEGVLICDPATVLEPDLSMPPPETVLAGLVLGRDTLEAAIRIHDESFFQSPVGHWETVWYDEETSTFLTISLDRKSTIVLMHLSRKGPTPQQATTLDSEHLSTGKGLRLGDSMSKVRELYGSTDKIDKHPENEPHGSQQWWYIGWRDEPGKGPVLHTLVITFDKDKKVSRIELHYN